jgi:uncharacterized protein
MSRNPRYVPQFRVTVDGAPLPQAMRGSVTSINLQTGLEGADRVELSLANDNLRWLDHPLLKLDKTLALHLGYAPDPLEQMFVGDIVSHNAAFPSSGTPTLGIAAQDRRQRLQQGGKVRQFSVPIPTVGAYAMPDTAVASIVALENGFVPLLEPVGAALSVLLGVAQAAAAGNPGQLQKNVRKQEGESDFQFLDRIAKENGWEIVVDHAGPLGGMQLRFLSPLDHLTPDVTLKYGRSLIEFTPRLTKVGEIVSVSAFVWIAQLKTNFTVSVGWDWDRMSLSLKVSPAFTPMGSAPSHVVLDDPVTLASAPRTILSELIPRLNRRLTASGSCVGDPRIKAGSVLRIEGVGEALGGLYRVVSATHAIDGGGYRTSFDLRKEIWFGSIPPAQQGAIPVRVVAPALN